MKKLLAVTGMFVLLTQANAATILFDLQGTAGFGLLAGNEPSLITPTTASGGEIGGGISFDTVSSQLTINAGWGSSQGFNDLSSEAIASSIQGPTASSGGAGFTETAGVFYNLTRSSDLSTGGIFTSPPITLTLGQQIDLIDGKFYINIRTQNNPGGEVRGFLVMVPEPGMMGLLGLGLTALLAYRRRS